MFYNRIRKHTNIENIWLKKVLEQEGLLKAQPNLHLERVLYSKGELAVQLFDSKISPINLKANLKVLTNPF